MRSVRAVPPAVLFLLAAALAAEAQTLTRGPYLQQGNQNGVVVRWRTSSASNSRVRIGTSIVNPLPTIVDDPTSTTEHQVAVTGLLADTKYYYHVGSTSSMLFAPDANHFFVTSPSPGAPKATRVWVLGDAGTQAAAQTNVKNAYTTFTGATHTDLWLMLGDNAYNTGTDAEYQGAVFNMYPAMLQKSVLWSTRGNHESDGGGATYYGMFTFPTNAEAGGLASGSEAYYSFDYGNIHFICLDSEGSSLSSVGPMATWLQNDLNATLQYWIVAFWHHPPYTKGSHDSDNAADSGGRMRDMRQNLLPILEAGGVDLVLCGHSHSYERSFLLNGHYGLSGTLTNAMKVDGGSGRDPAPYRKDAGAPPNAGAVYAVAGSSGQTSGGTLNHPAHFISLNLLGSMVLDFNGSRLDARFLRDTGATDDWFSIVKNTPPPPLPVVTITANDPSAAEAGLATGQFTVSRGTAAPGALTVSFTVGGGATNGTDFAAIATPVTIPGGAASATITVTPIQDTVFEGDETVVVTLATGSGYTVGSPSSALVTIAENDPAPGDGDADGLPDAWETTYFGGTGAQIGSGDADTDGLTNLQEYALGTNPAVADTDGDGIPDGWELQYGLNPASAADGGTDADGDGVANLAEYQGGSDPRSAGSIPAPPAGGGSGGGGGCGATGLEAALLVGMLGILGRRRSGYAYPATVWISRSRRSPRRSFSTSSS